MARHPLLERRPPIVLVRESKDTSIPGQEGLSPFLAKVLEQLSITSWLPAALFVTNGAIVAGLYMVQPDIPGAPRLSTAGALQQVASALNDKPVGVLLGLFIALVTTTLVMQSLEFTAIRFLEGYWGSGFASAVPWRLGVALQALRYRLLVRSASRLEAAAFEAVIPLIKKRFEKDFTLAAAIVALGRREPVEGVEPATVVRAQAYVDSRQWLEFAPAHLRNRIIAADIRSAAYPRQSRLMPTRLGNTLRAVEGEMKGDVAGGRLRGYLIRNVARIDRSMLAEHHVHRRRLDMYAVMAVLCVLIAAGDLALLPPVTSWTFARWVAGVALVLAYLSYRGAILAATAYGTVLLAINEHLEQESGRRRGA